MLPDPHLAPVHVISTAWDPVCYSELQIVHRGMNQSQLTKSHECVGTSPGPAWEIIGPV